MIKKWNANPRVEHQDMGTLDSAESVDIYLKQHGYSSQTGLPFPFDGGICITHSLMDLTHPSTLSPVFSARQNFRFTVCTIF